MTEPLETEGLFEPPLTYADPDAKDRLDSLVGLDDHKERLSKMLTLLVVPGALRNWADRFHDGALTLVNTVLARPPLVVLAGDVGCGKTALAESIADPVAREQDISITLFPLSLSARGKGAVGEMTQLLSAAFDRTYTEALKVAADDGEPARGAVILLIDEADALAQSREAAQMHHEDRAGVNALVRGVDRLAKARLPVAIIMCTNRPDALDPAVQRRAADILDFKRPDWSQREAVLAGPLRELGLGDAAIAAMVEATGSVDGGASVSSDYGFTFSDLTQRLLPTIVLRAFPSNAVEAEAALEIARSMRPTRPFGGAGRGSTETTGC
jgi:AAA+ superfamily predicted ATPase